jgi:hypothetical protein
MERRLQRLFDLLATCDEEQENSGLPETILSEAELCMFGAQPYFILDGYRRWAMPVRAYLDHDGVCRLVILQQLAELMSRECDRPSIVELMRQTAPVPGYDDRGVPSIDLSVHTLSAEVLCPRVVTLPLTRDGISRALLTSLVRIEHDYAYMFSATPSPHPKSSPPSAALNEASAA